MLWCLPGGGARGTRRRPPPAPAPGRRAPSPPPPPAPPPRRRPPPTGEGGYARELTADERVAQQQELNEHIAGMDVVVTTAQVPGRRPPLLVTAEAVGRMKPGSVIVDMAASDLGGNVELSRPGETVNTENGVTILAPTNLPAEMPTGASTFYAR